MKKLLFTAAIAAFALVSCNKENNETVNPEPHTEGSEVVINFDKAGGQFDTRAFFDNTADAEPWEKKINKAVIYVFDDTGKQIMRKDFSVADIATQKTQIILPTEYQGVNCTFYAAVNTDPPSSNITNESSMLSYKVIATNDYATLFDAMTTSARPLLGFAMSGKSQAVVQPKGTPTNVSIIVKRPIAKVAIQISIDPSFSAKYGGGKIIDINTKIETSVTSIPLFVNPGYNYRNDTRGVSQTAKLDNGKYNNLFYVGESPLGLGLDKTGFTISALFDQDGKSNTADDRFYVEWNVKLDGSGGGEIKRNGYYRLALNIKSMNAIDDIDAILQVSEWETPSSQSGELNETNQN